MVSESHSCGLSLTLPSSPHRDPRAGLGLLEGRVCVSSCYITGMLMVDAAAVGSCWSSGSRAVVKAPRVALRESGDMGKAFGNRDWGVGCFFKKYLFLWCWRSFCREGGTFPSSRWQFGPCENTDSLRRHVQVSIYPSPG